MRRLYRPMRFGVSGCCTTGEYGSAASEVCVLCVNGRQAAGAYGSDMLKACILCVRTGIVRLARVEAYAESVRFVREWAQCGGHAWKWYAESVRFARER